MIKKILCVIAVIALSGCAVTYTYDGQKYDSKEAFHNALDSKRSEVLASITPLPAPLTKKKLLFAMPSEAIFVMGSTERFIKAQGNQPTGAAKEILENLPKATFKNIKIFYDAVQKKNIFALTQFIEMQAATGSFEASNDTDTLYYVEPSQGSGQWYYSSIKNGKQIFAYDRSNPTPGGKVQAFVDAVQAQAIRD